MTGSQAADLKSQIVKLGSYLRRWGLRLRLVESLAWGPWGAAAGLGVGLLLALAARLWPLLRLAVLAGLAGLLALSGAAVGLAAAWLRPRPLHGLARTFDRRFGLAERLTTAVEIGAGRLRTLAHRRRTLGRSDRDPARGSHDHALDCSEL